MRSYVEDMTCKQKLVRRNRQEDTFSLWEFFSAIENADVVKHNLKNYVTI